MPFADQRQDARQDRPVQRPMFRLVLFQQLRPVIRVVDRLRQEKVRAVEYLAMQILALSNDDLAIKLREDRIAKAKKVEMDSLEIERII